MRKPIVHGILLAIIALNYQCAGNQGRHQIIAPDAEIKKLSKGQFKFTEGPAWDGKGNIYFSDIPQDSINVYHLDNQSFSVWSDTSKGTNGLMFNRQGNIVACQSRVGRLVELSPDGKLINVLAGQFNGTRFNSPNDLVIDSHGGVYFTDPFWRGTPPQGVTGVYYISSEGQVSRVVDDMNKPNGIIFSPDEQYLYINDSFSTEIRRYKVASPGQLTEKKVFAHLKTPDDYNREEGTGADGVAMDEKGNLYVTSRFGLQVFDKEGNFITRIHIPQKPSNCVFVGDDLKTLFITARTNVYSVNTVNKGVYFPINK